MREGLSSHIPVTKCYDRVLTSACTNLHNVREGGVGKLCLQSLVSGLLHEDAVPVLVYLLIVHYQEDHWVVPPQFSKVSGGIHLRHCGTRTGTTS